MQVIVPSTPHGQFFHALRRQMLRKFRKPLVAMMPKAMLRDPTKASEIAEFTDRNFELVIDDPAISDRDRVRRVLLCTGKVLHRTAQCASQRRKRAVAGHCHRAASNSFIRSRKKNSVKSWPSTSQRAEVVWVQEKPKNRGAWTFMEPRLRAMLPDTIVNYVGRDAAASPATGSKKDHDKEEHDIVAAALEVSRRSQPVHTATQPGTAAAATSVTPVSG